MTTAQGFAVGLGYAPAPAPVAAPPRARGPWCQFCGHEYRTREGAPEVAGLFPMATCPYCRAQSAPVHTKPFHEISKSEIEKFSPELGPDKGCKRRWFYGKLLGLPEPKNPYAELGILGHGMAEAWLKHRHLPVIDSLRPKDPKSLVGMALLGGIPHAPTADTPGLEVEREFHFEFEGVRYMGYKDFSGPTGTGWPLSPVSLGYVDSPAVGDWKFTSDLKWAPTPEALAVDVQAIIYGWDEIERYKPPTAPVGWRHQIKFTAPDSVWLSWVFMQRGTRNARPVRVLLHRDHLRAGMQRLNVIAREMLAYRGRYARGELTDRDVPGNARACKSFGKMCPHVERCPMTAEERLASIMSNAFDEIMRATSPVAPPPVPAAPVAFAPLPPPAAPAFVPPVGILPPPAPVAVAVAPIPPPPFALVKMQFPDGKVYDVEAHQCAGYAASHGATVLAAAPAPLAPPAVAPAHAGPGRPPGTRKPRTPAAPKAVAQSAPVAAPVPATPAPAAVIDVVGTTLPPSLGFTLMINAAFDALPEGARRVNARDIIAVVAQEMCSDQNVKYYGGVANGQGPYLLNLYLENMAREGLLNLDADTIVDLDKHTIEGRDTLSTFEKLAGMICRGTA